MAGSVIVTGLRQALAGYLELRRGLGFKLERHAGMLGQFVSWLEDHGAATVTTADAVAWVTLPERASPGWLQYRMQAVRGFAAYLATLDPATEVPPPGLLPGGPRRAVPYLYSDADIAALFAHAGKLMTPLRQETTKTLIGLMAVTGIRGGEALGARRSGLRSRPRAAAGPPRQARPTPAAAAAPHHGDRGAVLPAAAGPALPPPAQPGAAGLHRRDPADPRATSAGPSPRWPVRPDWRGRPGTCRPRDPRPAGIRRTAGLCALPWRFRW